MNMSEVNKVIRYSYNWYCETRHIPLLFTVSYATPDVMDVIIEHLTGELQVEAANCKVAVVPNETGDTATKEFLLEVLFPFPVNVLPFVVFDSMRKRCLRRVLVFLNKYEESCGVSITFTLDFKDFKRFVAYELMSVYSLPQLPLLEDGEILKLGHDSFKSRYTSWVLGLAEVSVAKLSAEEVAEVMREVPAYTKEIHNAYSHIDEPMGNMYVLRNFATHIIEAKLLEEINDFLKRIQKLE